MAGKGRPKTGGRQAGTPNKVSGTLKEMILDALEQKGGVAYLVKRAEDTPAAFMILLGKVLPTQVQGDPEFPLNGLTDEVIESRLAALLAQAKD